MLKCGIIGMPNVGKSSLFNVLSKGTVNAKVGNFPFCTIEPNICSVPVMDNRLQTLATISKSQQIIYTSLQFVDIAGLVKGASKGEGRGNDFLKNIQEVDAIVHLVRCFTDKNILHINPTIDPVDDVKTIILELILADLQTVDKYSQRKKIDASDEHLCTQIKKKLEQELVVELTADEKQMANNLRLLSQKPTLFVCNIDNNSRPDNGPFFNSVQQYLHGTIRTNNIMAICVPSSELELIEKGTLDPTLSQLTRQLYILLNLITFFTTGPKESRAWTTKKGTKALNAAGIIHTDFQKKFIRSETVSYHNFVNHNGNRQTLKQAGHIRFEGKEYIIQDGDILYFHHS